MLDRSTQNTKSGVWQGESLPCPQKDGTEEFFNWHPGLDKSIKARRQVGRPKKKMGRRSQRIHENQRRTRSEEQQQLGGKN